MSNWIHGYGAVKKLSLVKDAFRANRLLAISRLNGYNLKTYHPIMANAENAAEISQSDLNDVIEITNLVCMEKSRLELLNRVYSTPRKMNLPVFNSKNIKWF